ncbi:hypothetical protein VCRA2117O328_10233 [Vibrio crassostreae]|nr:hypothetical protein VCRA2117O328_10233 [Vibrio crassostreae]
MILDKNLELTPEIDYKKCFNCSSRNIHFIRVNEPDAFENYEHRTCLECKAEWFVNHFAGEIHYTLTNSNNNEE